MVVGKMALHPTLIMYPFAALSQALLMFMHMLVCPRHPSVLLISSGTYGNTQTSSKVPLCHYWRHCCAITVPSLYSHCADSHTRATILRGDTIPATSLHYHSTITVAHTHPLTCAAVVARWLQLLPIGVPTSKPELVPQIHINACQITANMSLNNDECVSLRYFPNGLKMRALNMQGKYMLMADRIQPSLYRHCTVTAPSRHHHGSYERAATVGFRCAKDANVR